jgi:hypothetical protein
MGVSIGSKAGSTGTLGAFVRVGREVGLLSNRHVLDPAFAGTKGLSIVQPGGADGGSEEIATFRSSHPISFTDPNKADAAVAVLDAGVNYDATQLRGYGALDPVPADPVAYHLVGKVGRTSGLTTGFIRSVELDGVEVDYGSNRIAIFNDQVEIVGHYFKRPFAEIGDSGSLIFDLNDRRPVALHFAAGEPEGPQAPSVAYATPIGEVLRLLEADFVVAK